MRTELQSNGIVRIVSENEFEKAILADVRAECVMVESGYTSKGGEIFNRYLTFDLNKCVGKRNPRPKEPNE